MRSPLLPPERNGRPAPDGLLANRTALAKALGAVKGAPASHADAQEIAEVRALRFGDGDATRPLMVHFHGGGFRQGQPEMIAAYASDLAFAAGIEVWCPTYRLAPEHPFPAALNDGLRLVDALAGRSGRPLILAGDSAGGGLAASLACLCGVEGIPISALVLHSPWLDLTVSSETYALNAEHDALFSYASASEAADLYLQGHSPEDAFASAIFADPAQFPTTFVSVGEIEVLLDDAVSFHWRLMEAGCPAELCRVEGMTHVAVTRDRSLPGAGRVFEQTVRFLHEAVSIASA